MLLLGFSIRIRLAFHFFQYSGRIHFALWYFTAGKCLRILEVKLSSTGAFLLLLQFFLICKNFSSVLCLDIFEEYRVNICWNISHSNVSFWLNSDHTLRAPTEAICLSQYTMAGITVYPSISVVDFGHLIKVLPTSFSLWIIVDCFCN